MATTADDLIERWDDARQEGRLLAVEEIEGSSDATAEVLADARRQIADILAAEELLGPPGGLAMLVGGEAPMPEPRGVPERYTVLDLFKRGGWGPSSGRARRGSTASSPTR
ncbi:MAG TPA: hypothetical protein VG406_01340 [Isosphaeraceae bacterium]|jgi:hypothetical protein|nr:hypothetical protein [Isosphaeraceae bacterium]